MAGAVNAAPLTNEFKAIVQSGDFGPGAGESITGRITYDTDAVGVFNRSDYTTRFKLDKFELDVGNAGKVSASDVHYVIWDSMMEPITDQVTFEARRGKDGSASPQA